MIAPFVIAAALAFCERVPDSPVCSPREVAVVELDRSAERRIAAAAASIRSIPHYRADARDYWSEADASEVGDCEDYILRLARRLAHDDPELFSAFRVVMLVMERREGAPMSVHIVGVIETTRGPIVLNARDEPRPWSDLRDDRREAYTPTSAISGPWVAYSPGRSEPAATRAAG